MKNLQEYREPECVSVLRDVAQVEARVTELINIHGFNREAVMKEMEGTGHESEAKFCFNWMEFTAETGENKKKSI